jgi:hypothetical protein
MSSNDVPGAFGKSNILADPAKRMQDCLRRYEAVAMLVDREVMKWHSLPPEQQSIMDEVIVTLNELTMATGNDMLRKESCYVLGVLYDNGRGMPNPKPARAVELYQSAAEGGSKEALFNLATLTRTGAEGVPRNLELAFVMYETAALQQHVKAAYNVACMYMNGEGVDRNRHKADEWFSFAAERGHGDALKSMNKIDRQQTVMVMAVFALTLITGTIVTLWTVKFGSDFVSYFWKPDQVDVASLHPGFYSRPASTDDDTYR